MALAEPAGCSVVSSCAGCAGPGSPSLKGTLVALTSWAGRGFMRLSVKNRSGQVLHQWACLVKGPEGAGGGRHRSFQCGRTGGGGGKCVK